MSKKKDSRNTLQNCLNTAQMLPIRQNISTVPRAFLRRGEGGRPPSPRRRKALGTRLWTFLRKINLYCDDDNNNNNNNNNDDDDNHNNDNDNDNNNNRVVIN